MKKKQSNGKKEPREAGALKLFFSAVGDYISKKYPYLILWFMGLLAVSAVNFIKISTSQTVASFNINEFEIGQISDRTIIADRTIPPDDADPIAIIDGEKIIKKGFPITEEGFAKLKKMSASPIYIDYRIFANNELYLLLLSVMWYLLFTFIPFRKKLQFKEPLLHVIFFLLVYSVAALGGKLSLFSTPYSICIIIPSALCIMLTTILFGDVSAVLLSFIMSAGVLCATGWSLPTFIFTLAACLTSAGIVRKIDKRLNLVAASIMLAVFEVVYTIFILVIFNEALVDLPKLLIGIFVNGFLSGILTLGFLTPLEAIMNTASVFRLMDLSNTDNPVLKQMQIQANGTYGHSMNVALLAESACREIGANALLAKVGAYFHDIGKIDQSEYFVENQLNNENKHDDLNPTLSASIIKSHVKKGVEKGHQMHLPLAVLDIIAEHHGNSVITYFFNEGKEKDPTLSEEDFSYPGNPPSTRESAVVMLADTVEAACRTLENPTASRLEKFISQLVNAKVEHKQLDNCDLTFRDITKIKDSFVHILTGYYHNRIKYQNQKDPEEK